jgi:hypothetical protein
MTFEEQCPPNEVENNMFIRKPTISKYPLMKDCDAIFSFGQVLSLEIKCNNNK